MDLLQCSNKNAGLKEMNMLGLQNLPIPGDVNFPLNAMYSKPDAVQAGKTFVICLELGVLPRKYLRRLFLHQTM